MSEEENKSHRSIPKFYGLRIYLTSIMLYFFLVLPFIGFIIFQNVPTFIENRTGGMDQVAAKADSLIEAFDSVQVITEEEMDNMLKLTFQDDVNELTDTANQHEESEADASFDAEADTVQVGHDDKEDEGLDMFSDKGPFSRYFTLLFILLGVSLLAGYIYNRPFKRFFSKSRRDKEIPKKLQEVCKKRLFKIPLVNSLIITMPNIVVIVYSLIFLVAKVSFDEEVERSMFIQLHYLTIVSTLLEFLFVYYWEKHRVHIKYIDHIYSEIDLRKQVFRRKGGKIRNRFLVASGMTTFLPLVVVMVYMFLSITSIKELKLDEYSEDHREILFGPWSEIIGIGKDLKSNNSNGIEVDSGGSEKFFYVNAIDSIVMFVGIGNGILVSLIYLLLFIRWTNQDITRPVKELLQNIRNTTGGGAERYTIVRTNDEIGELAVGYNEMTEKIHAYVESISKMNRELEDKVKERTREVVMQKEEIEAQKEEIEAQLDLTTLQRDTITSQNELILDSIRYAERIQAAILPPIDHLSDHLSDHFILFKPRDIVSGDFYWTKKRGNKLLVAVADCTGHGVPGAFLSMLGISAMNEIINRNEGLRANEILEKLRDFMITSLHQTGSKGETQDGIEIALCVIDQKAGILEFSGANRPVYLVRENSLQQLKPDRMPIGIYDHQVRPFTSQKVDIKKGDSLYLFSDGYVDQMGGPSRKTFRSKRFRELLIKVQNEPMEHQKKSLGKSLAKWQGEVEQIDDILVIGIRL